MTTQPLITPRKKMAIPPEIHNTDMAPPIQRSDNVHGPQLKVEEPVGLPSNEEVEAAVEALCNNPGERRHRYGYRQRTPNEIEIFSRSRSFVMARLFFGIEGKRDAYHIIYDGTLSQSIRESGEETLKNFIELTK